MCARKYEASPINSATSSMLWPWKSSSISLRPKMSETSPTEAARIPPRIAARRTSGPPPIPIARRCASARLTSCSSGWKNPGATDEDEGPEAVERGVLGVGQLARRQDLEAVRRDADDDQSAADRVGALGQRTVLGRTDQPLRSLCHSPSLGCPEIRDCTAAGARGRCRGPGSRRVGSTVLGVSTRTLRNSRGPDRPRDPRRVRSAGHGRGQLKG